MCKYKYIFIFIINSYTLLNPVVLHHPVIETHAALMAAPLLNKYLMCF